MLQRYNLVRETTIIDALRGTAALLVLLAHADAHYLIRFDWLLPYKGYFGEIGVYLFFMLSGFLIWSSALRQLERQEGFRTYVIHRVTRIMPLYYLALIFGILIFPALSNFPVDTSSWAILRNATFTQSLLPSASRAINPVLWTLTHEAIFYTLVPLLFLARRIFPLILALAAVGTWCGYVTYDGTFSPFLRLCFLFAIGMALSHYQLCPTRLLAELSTLAAIFMGLAGFSSTLISVTWAIALLAIAASLRDYRQTAAVRAFAWVGVCSYSLYIWHYMLIEIVGPMLMHGNHFPLHHPYVTAVGFTAFCIVFARISYELIERPGLTHLREALMKFAVVKQPKRTGNPAARENGVG